MLGVLGALGVLGVEPRLPEPLVLPDPVVLPEPLVLPDPMLPEPEVLPEPLVLPYWRTQSSFSVPVLPMHWLGSAAVSLLVLPVAPELVEPDAPEPVEPEAPVPALPPTLGLVVEPLLPEVCAQVTVARPRRAAATAALSCFAITMVLSFGWEDCSPRHASGMPRHGMRAAESPRGGAWPAPL